MEDHGHQAAPAVLAVDHVVDVVAAAHEAEAHAVEASHVVAAEASRNQRVAAVLNPTIATHQNQNRRAAVAVIHVIAIHAPDQDQNQNVVIRVTDLVQVNLHS